jgi:hypothetical protein
VIECLRASGHVGFFCFTKKGEFTMAVTMNSRRQRLPMQNGKSPKGPATAEAKAHSEGMIARSLEKQTAKLPSDVWLWSALGSMGASLFLHLSGRKKDGLFVGQWAAPFLLLGVYNKLVKLNGSDRVHDRNTK